jgi:hypothetical protein
MTVKELLINVLDPILAREGYSVYFAAVKIQLRRRLQVDKSKRPKRDELKKSQKQKLFDRQKGICPWCDQPLEIPAWKNKGDDHINVNIEGDAYNALSNRQLLHEKCNLEKGAMSIQEQSKAGHGTFHQIIRTPSEEEV